MNAAKAVLKEKFIMINAYIKSNERSQIKKFTFHIKKLEKEKKNSKVNRKKEIKIRTQTCKIEVRKWKTNISEKINI